MKKHVLHLKSGEVGALSDLKRGQAGIVVAIDIDNRALRRHLLDMGITRGVRVEIKKFAPLGDPVDVRVRGYELCLRKSDMKGIQVRCE